MEVSVAMGMGADWATVGADAAANCYIVSASSVQVRLEFVSASPQPKPSKPPRVQESSTVYM